PELPPGVVLEVGPIQPRPFDLMGWRNEVLTANVAPGEASIVGQEQATTKAAGWPCALFVSDVKQGGKVVERRLHVFYLLQEHGAVAVLRGEPAKVDPLLPAIRDLLLEAQPDWSTPEVATLAQIWEGFEDEGRPPAAGA